jgi:hypothetical protein
MKAQYMSYIVTGVRKIYMYLLWYKVFMYFTLVRYGLPIELIISDCSERKNDEDISGPQGCNEEKHIQNLALERVGINY